MLSNTISKLQIPSTSKKDIKQLLYKSNTGKFWDKFAAISGMFRFAYVHKEEGISGIIDRIKKSKINPVD